jgi:Skp family chaperone for outer membrane proteins
MKKTAAVLTLALAFTAGAVVTAQVHDWHDLDKVQQHVSQAIDEMERARSANHFDMEGHGAKAEEHLRAAQRELDMAIQSSRRH